MNTYMSRIGVVMVLVCIPLVSSAQVLDLQTGRTADLQNEPAISVEGGVVIGDHDYLGARGNLKAADNVLLMADLGFADFGDEELALGVDAMFQLKTTAENPIAIKVGAAFLPDADHDVLDLSALAIISGAVDEKISWYANAGLHWVDTDNRRDDTDLVPVIGGGAVFKISGTASAFAGIDALLGDIYDDIVLGGGARFSL